MKVKDLFENWGLKGIKFNFGIAELDFNPEPIDQEAAWELYVELVTRIATQELEVGIGTEEAALKSIHNLFGITRDILKSKGRKCVAFSKIAIVLLNQFLRPFTSKWHKKSSEGAFEHEEHCDSFRNELSQLQHQLQVFTLMLAKIASVEDLTDTNQLGDSSSLSRLDS